MSTSEGFHALRRANPRHEATFAESVESVAGEVRARVATSTEVVFDPPSPTPPHRRLCGRSRGCRGRRCRFPRHRIALGGPGVENAAAAIEHAATVTAASAEQSGTAVVRITHDGDFWAGKTVRWNGADVAIPRRSTPPGPAGERCESSTGSSTALMSTGSWLDARQPDQHRS